MMPGSDPERRAQNLLEQFQKQEVDSDSEYLFGPRENLDWDSALWRVPICWLKKKPWCPQKTGVGVKLFKC